MAKPKKNIKIESTEEAHELVSKVVSGIRQVFIKELSKYDPEEAVFIIGRALNSAYFSFCKQCLDVGKLKQEEREFQRRLKGKPT